MAILLPPVFVPPFALSPLGIATRVVMSGTASVRAVPGGVLGSGFGSAFHPIGLPPFAVTQQPALACIAIARPGRLGFEPVAAFGERASGPARRVIIRRAGLIFTRVRSGRGMVDTGGCRCLLSRIVLGHLMGPRRAPFLRLQATNAVLDGLGHLRARRKIIQERQQWIV